MTALGSEASSARTNEEVAKRAMARRRGGVLFSCDQRNGRNGEGQLSRSKIGWRIDNIGQLTRQEPRAVAVPGGPWTELNCNHDICEENGQ